MFAGVAERVAPWWDADPSAVVKVAETPPMQGRSGRARARAAEAGLRPALVVPRPDRVAGHRVLVIDDVLTAGSTLREVARALLAAGALEVGGLVLARRGEGSGRGCDPVPRGPMVAGCRPIW
jgi:predicted amidophosphoribosyltransferase